MTALIDALPARSGSDVAGNVGPMVQPSMDAEPLEMGEARRERRDYAELAVVLGGLAAIVSSGGTLSLFRDTLHYNCSWGVGGEWGEGGTWLCADGIGYIVVAVGLGGMSALLLLVGLFVSTGRPSLLRAVTLVVFASVLLAWIGWWSFFSATAYTGPRPPGETGLGLWVETLGPSLGLCGLGLLIGVAGVAVGRRWALVGVSIGAFLMIFGTALDFGMGVSTLAAAGLLVAGGIQRGALGPARDRPRLGQGSDAPF